MANELANLLASRFIARPDVKAKQLVTSDGAVIYTPHGKRDNVTKQYTDYFPWNRASIDEHVSGRESYGHYLLDKDDTCKLFAFDVDLEKTGFYVPDFLSGNVADAVECNPREAWRDRAHPGRDFFKYQFRLVAHVLLKAVYEELAIPCAAAYSGNKGIHVYGFTGRVPADEAREGAMIVLDSLNITEKLRGEHFFAFKDKDPVDGFPNLSIEVFPKQGSLEGKDLGNLMRLPLGRNLKTPDPTFFMDMTAPMSELKPIDPVYALTTTNPWKRPGE